MQLEIAPRGQSADLAPRFSVTLASSEREVEAAQRLRWQVFVDEQGARISSPRHGLDIDEFDRHCEHLIVRDLRADLIIGTYRILTADAARRVGRYYSESEFDLSSFGVPRRNLLEIGRSCVHADYRNGATIALLWSGLAGFLMRSGHKALIGCASIPLSGQEYAGSNLARSLFQKHPSSPLQRVTPRRRLPFEGGGTGASVVIPPLIKGYLRSGAVVCGEPCWDPEFKTADVFITLDVANIEARYARRFISQPHTEFGA